MTSSNRGSIRILQVAGGGPMQRGGIETWLMHILRHIDRECFRMDFVAEEGEGAYDDEIRALGSPLIVCPHRRRPLAYARNFRRILRDQGPYDVVHSHFHYYSGHILRLARQLGVPIRIAHSHNDYRQDDKNRNALWRVYVGLMKRQIFQNATVGLASSRKAAEALFGEGWEDDPRWRLLYYGIDLNPFQVTVDPGAVRAELGIPAGAFVVGHVGKFDEQKNHAFLVDIAAELAEREPDVRLLLVGDGQLRPAIERRAMQANIADKVTFAGVRADVARLMLGAMDVFVMPSLYEGLGIAGIEAQAAGLPLIVSDVIPEEVGVVNSLVRRLSLSNPASVWAEVILAVQNTLSPITQQDALRSIEKSKFSINTSLRELERVYAG